MSPTGRQPHLLLLITEDWYFWSHRRRIALAAREAGFRVTLASRFSLHRKAIEDEGIAPVPISLRRRGLNPVRESRSILDLVRHYRHLRPDIVHHVSIKPVLYGSIAARIAGVRGVVNAISGLGYAFTGSGPKAMILGKVAERGYRAILRRSGTYTIFQNEDDRGFFVDRALVSSERTVIIRGSGVNLQEYRPQPEPIGGVPVLLYAGRMLWSKGIGDLVSAGKLLAQQGLHFRMVLIGHSDADNPEAITPGQLRQWQEEGLAEWWGHRDDVGEIMGNSHVVVLSSDREGVPKVLLEAAAAGRPIVASDVPGCREVVEEGKNGFLVPVHDPHALAGALQRLLLDPALRARMGKTSRQKAEAEFSEELVVRQTLALYEKVLADR